MLDWGEGSSVVKYMHGTLGDLQLSALKGKRKHKTDKFSRYCLELRQYSQMIVKD